MACSFRPAALRLAVYRHARFVPNRQLAPANPNTGRTASRLLNFCVEGMHPTGVPYRFDQIFDFDQSDQKFTFFASLVSNETLACLTPFTSSSADCTVAAQPPHVMPVISRITVSSFAATDSGIASMRNRSPATATDRSAAVYHLDADYTAQSSGRLTGRGGARQACVQSLWRMTLWYRPARESYRNGSLINHRANRSTNSSRRNR